MKKKLSRALRLLCAVLMLISITVPEYAPVVSTAQAVTQKEIDKLKEEAKELAKQQQETKSKLSELKNDRSRAIERLNLLDQQIAGTERAIANTEKQIAGYEAMLAQSEYELAEAQRMERETYEIFCRRARVMEEEGIPSFWSVLVKAENFSDLLSRLSDVQVVISYDQSILDSLRTQQREITEKLNYQSELKTAAEEAKLTLEAQKKDLDAQRLEANALVQEIQGNVAEYETILKAIEDEEEAIQKEIIKKNAELAEQMKQQATVGGYIWPVTTSKRITSDYGGRNTGIAGASTNHKGVDIGGVYYNSKVLAAKDGVVITSKYVSSYGNYVVISHGNGNTTLYAHMSSRSVKEGDKVKQGQVIGITGSTGISSGPHLHYEIVENGKRVDPKIYLPGWIKAW